MKRTIFKLRPIPSSIHEQATEITGKVVKAMFDGRVIVFTGTHTPAYMEAVMKKLWAAVPDLPPETMILSVHDEAPFCELVELQEGEQMPPIYCAACGRDKGDKGH